VSVDGPECIHDSLRKYRNGDGSFVKVKNGFVNITNLTGRKPSIESTFTPIHEKHGYNIKRLEDYFHAEFGSTIETIVPVNVPDDHPLAFSDPDVVSCDSTSSLFDSLSDRSYGNSPRIERNILYSILQVLMRKPRRFMCPIGYSRFTITTDGDIYPCQLFIGQKEFYMGNINHFNINDPSVDIIKAQNSLEYRDKYRNPKCTTCWAKHLCTACPASSLLKNNNYTTTDEFCMHSKERVELILSTLYELHKSPNTWMQFLENLENLSTVLSKEDDVYHC
jgi:uncharacterized protein